MFKLMIRKITGLALIPILAVLDWALEQLGSVFCKLGAYDEAREALEAQRRILKMRMKIKGVKDV